MPSEMQLERPQQLQVYERDCFSPPSQCCCCYSLVTHCLNVLPDFARKYIPSHSIHENRLVYLLTECIRDSRSREHRFLRVPTLARAQESVEWE